MIPTVIVVGMTRPGIGLTNLRFKSRNSNLYVTESQNLSASHYGIGAFTGAIIDLCGIFHEVVFDLLPQVELIS